MLAACGSAPVRVTLVAHTQALITPADVKSFDLWVVHGEDRAGNKVGCDVFPLGSPVSNEYIVLVPPVRGDSIENGAKLDVRGIPPSNVPRVFFLRLFSDPGQIGGQIGDGCTEVVLPPGAHTDLEILVTPP